MRDYIKDLIIDIRCAKRDGMPKYEEKCKAELARIFPLRNSKGVSHG